MKNIVFFQKLQTKKLKESIKLNHIIFCLSKKQFINYSLYNKFLMIYIL